MRQDPVTSRPQTEGRNASTRCFSRALILETGSDGIALARDALSGTADNLARSRADQADSHPAFAGSVIRLGLSG